MERKSNFELLRIVLMLFIVAGHVTMYSGKLSVIGTSDYYITNITRSFCMISVNTFILLSGYFGIKLKVDKLIKLDFRVIFYTWIIFIISVILKIHEINIIKDILLIFPVITKQYWFITIYFVLCIISPFLNKFLNSLSKQELKIFLIISFVLFYIISSFCYLVNAEQIIYDAGYGIVNFVCLYSLGYYLKNYYEDKYNFKVYLISYIIISLFTFLSNEIITRIMGFYFNSFISYNTVFTLLGAIFLFMAFKNLNIKNTKTINKIASKCLIVYVLHMNPTISKYLFKNILKVNELTGIKLILGLIIIPFIIYAISYVIDIIVDFILKPIENKIPKKQFELSD